MDVYELEKHKIIVEYLSVTRTKSWNCYQTICDMVTSGKLGTFHMRSRLVFHIILLFSYSILTPVLLILVSGEMIALEYFSDNHTQLYASYIPINEPIIFKLLVFILYCVSSVVAWCLLACGFAVVTARRLTIWLCSGLVFAILVITFGFIKFYDITPTTLCQHPLELGGFCIIQHISITMIFYWVFYHKQFVCLIKLMKSTQEKMSNDELFSPSFVERIVVARALGNYVALTLSNGTQMEVRQRFSDVVKRLKGSGGIQVHRSYWIKGKELLSVKKSRYRFFASTRFGEIPISKSYLERVNIVFGSRK